MPIREYKCPKCKKIQEEIVLANRPEKFLHEHGGKIYELDLVPFSVPARRNPRHGEQR